MKKNTSGFTIVELLIVIVVIAILAAISIVAYTGIQDRATASTVRSDLANFAKKIEMAKLDTVDGQYPANLTQVPFSVNASKSVYQIQGRSNWYYCVSSDRSDYALGLVDKSNRYYYQSSPLGTEIDTGEAVWASSTCAKVAEPSSSQNASNIGYYWSTSTNSGAWRAWTD